MYNTHFSQLSQCASSESETLANVSGPIGISSGLLPKHLTLRLKFQMIVGKALRANASQERTEAEVLVLQVVQKYRYIG